MTRITRDDVKALVNAGLIHNTSDGYVDGNGRSVGYYRTKGCARRIYVKDRIAALLSTL